MNGNGFTVQGSDFNRAVKLIKKAFPRKKKDQVLASAIVRVADNQVFVSMPGAEVQVKAFGYGRFSAEIPLICQEVLQRHYDHRNLLFWFGLGAYPQSGRKTFSGSPFGAKATLILRLDAARRAPRTPKR